MLKKYNAKHLIVLGALAFAGSISMSYVLYPHWRTFSVFGTMWRTLPLFLIAMGVTFLLLWYVGGILRNHRGLHGTGNILRLSASCLVAVVLIPYMNSDTQKALHNSAALLFAVFSSVGIIWVAKILRSFMLGLLAGVQIGICILELIFLARYNEHTVYPWVWVVLQLIITGAMLVSLFVLVSLLEKKTSGNS